MQTKVRHIKTKQFDHVALLHTLYRSNVVAQIADQHQLCLSEGESCAVDNSIGPHFNFSDDRGRTPHGEMSIVGAINDRLIVRNQSGDKTRLPGPADQAKREKGFATARHAAYRHAFGIKRNCGRMHELAGIIGHNGRLLSRIWGRLRSLFSFLLLRQFGQGNSELGAGDRIILIA